MQTSKQTGKRYSDKTKVKTINNNVRVLSNFAPDVVIKDKKLSPSSFVYITVDATGVRKIIHIAWILMSCYRPIILFWLPTEMKLYFCKHG